MAKRWRLNPCDYMFLSYDRMMTARGRIGHSTLMVLDIEGEIEPERLRRALGLAMDAHPITRATIRDGLISGRPCWVERPGGDADVLKIFDLRGVGDFHGAAIEEMARCLAEPLPVERVAPIRIEYYVGAGGQGRLCLKWSHALTDGEGAQWFLSEVARCDAGATVRPVELCDDELQLDPLNGRGLVRRLRLFASGFRGHREHAGVPQTSLGDRHAEGSAELRIHYRMFDAAEFERIRANAKRICPPGAGLYARYLAGCVIRAVHRMYQVRGIETPAYLVTLPVSVRPEGARPLAGNYLVFATMSGRRERVDDARDLAVDLHEQMTRFGNERRGEALWALLSVMGWMRAGQYRWLLRQPIGLQPYVSGFSYYGEIGPPLTEFLGARVTNLYGVAPLAAPPGWNPIFSRFGDRLNFALTWIRGYIADEVGEEFAKTTEVEALGGQ